MPSEPDQENLELCFAESTQSVREFDIPAGELRHQMAEMRALIAEVREVVRELDVLAALLSVPRLRAARGST